MEDHRAHGEHDVAASGDDLTIVALCPSCASRARAFQQPNVRGLKVTSVVLFGLDGGETWTVMARRSGNILAKATAETEEEALFDVLEALGVHP